MTLDPEIAKAIADGKRVSVSLPGRTYNRVDGSDFRRWELDASGSWVLRDSGWGTVWGAMRDVMRQERDQVFNYGFYLMQTLFSDWFNYYMEWD